MKKRPNWIELNFIPSINANSNHNIASQRIPLKEEDSSSLAASSRIGVKRVQLS